MSDPVPLPLERHMADAMRLIFGAPLRWWRARFVGNPLLPWETRLGEGRRWWRSPALWCVVLSLVLAAWSLSDDIGRILMMRALRADSPNDQMLDVPLRHGPLRQSIFAAGWVILGVPPILCVARAWGQERDERSREQLALTLITAKQLLAARFLLWLGIALLLPLALRSWDTLRSIAAWALDLPEASTMRIRVQGTAPRILQNTAGMTAVAVLFTLQGFLASFASVLATVSVATFVTLRWRLALAGLLAGIAALQIIEWVALPTRHLAIAVLSWTEQVGGTELNHSVDFTPCLPQLGVAVALGLLARREVLRAYHFRD